MLRMTPISQAASGQKASVTSNPKYALLFDCDGVIVLTEELHRLAYNGAFQDYNLKIGETPVDWNVEYYDVLQNTVGGGKPKMKWHFNKNGWPSSRLGPAPTSAADQDRLVDELQDRKTEIYKRIVTEVAQARPGVLSLIDEVLDRTDIAAGICSAATKAGFDQVAALAWQTGRCILSIHPSVSARLPASFSPLWSSIPSPLRVRPSFSLPLCRRSCRRSSPAQAPHLCFYVLASIRACVRPRLSFACVCPRLSFPPLFLLASIRACVRACTVSACPFTPKASASVRVCTVSNHPPPPPPHHPCYGA